MGQPCKPRHDYIHDRVMPEPSVESKPSSHGSRSALAQERAVPPFRVMRAVTENSRMMSASLQELVTHKRWVFAAMAIAFALSTWIYWRNPPLYDSTVSFYVLAPPVSDKDEPIYLSLQTDPITLRHIATSTAMFDHLVAKYDLQTHYGIPNGTPDERAILHQMLQSRVTVDLRESEIVSVMVKDSDRAMAALLANELYTACDSMLRADQQIQLAGQIRVYDQVIDSTDGLARERSAQLLRIAGVLQDLRKDPSKGMDDARGEQVEQALIDAADDVASINHDLVVQRRNRANLLVMAQDAGAGPVRLKSKATEDLGPTPLYRSIQWILTITIAAGVVSAALLLLIIETWMTPPLPAQVSVRR